MRQLSERQERILSFIEEYMDDHGRPPTVREIGTKVGISSTSVVDYNLKALERQGRLQRDRDLARGIELPNRRQAPAIPILGSIAAGEPIDAVENPEDFVEVAPHFVREGCYALRVKGTSMIEDQIDDGDIVIVHPQSTANDGETVVALITSGPTPTGAATLKRFYREPDRIRLQPRNAALSPIYVAREDLQIQGRVVEVRKTF